MEKRGRTIVCIGFIGILIGFFYAAGPSLDEYYNLDFRESALYIRWIFLSVLCGAVVWGIWKLVAYFEKKELGARSLWKYDTACVCAILIFICWIPAWLSIFPGAFNYDALQEWQQVREGTITAHHPVVHVLLLGGLLEMAHALTGSYNVGIAVYTGFQMAILSAVFGYTLDYLKRFHLPQWLRVVLLLFYGLSPVMQLFAISATKDVLFTAAQLVFLLQVISFCVEKEDFWKKRGQVLTLVCSAIATMILRNNGLYIVLIMFVFMFWYSRHAWKKFLLVFGAGILTYAVYVGPFYQMLSVTPGGIQEMLSVPIQQMARVYHYDYVSLEEEDVEFLYRILPRKNLEQYRSTVSDFVKSGFKTEAFEENKGAFFKLWVKWGVEHPLVYVNSFLVNTVDAWYPGAVIDGYQDVYGKSSYFDYQVDEPGEEYVILPWLHEWYEAISTDKDAQKVPLAFLVLNPGWYFVCYLVIACYLFYRRRYQYLVPFLILLLTMLTVLLGPMVLVRYLLIFYYAMPVEVAVLLYGRHYDKGRNIL